MKWIAINAVDGVGKDMLLELLEPKFFDAGLHAKKVAMPGGTELGHLLRVAVKLSRIKVEERAARLIFAADAVQTFAETRLLSGVDVLLFNRWVPFTDHIYNAAAGEDPTFLFELHNLVLADKPLLDELIVLTDDWDKIKFKFRKEHMNSRPGSPADRIDQKGWEFLRRVYDLYADVNSPSAPAYVFARRCLKPGCKPCLFDCKGLPPKENAELLFAYLTRPEAYA